MEDSSDGESASCDYTQEIMDLENNYARYHKKALCIISEQGWRDTDLPETIKFAALSAGINSLPVFTQKGLIKLVYESYCNEADDSKPEDYKMAEISQLKAKRSPRASYKSSNRAIPVSHASSIKQAFDVSSIPLSVSSDQLTELISSLAPGSSIGTRGSAAASVSGRSVETSPESKPVDVAKQIRLGVPNSPNTSDEQEVRLKQPPGEVGVAVASDVLSPAPEPPVQSSLQIDSDEDFSDPPPDIDDQENTELLAPAAASAEFTAFPQFPPIFAPPIPPPTHVDDADDRSSTHETVAKIEYIPAPVSQDTAVVPSPEINPLRPDRSRTVTPNPSSGAISRASPVPRSRRQSSASSVKSSENISRSVHSGSPAPTATLKDGPRGIGEVSYECQVKPAMKILEDSHQRIEEYIKAIRGITLPLILKIHQWHKGNDKPRLVAAFAEFITARHALILGSHLVKILYRLDYVQNDFYSLTKQEQELTKWLIQLTAYLFLTPDIKQLDALLSFHCDPSKSQKTSFTSLMQPLLEFLEKTRLTSPFAKFIIRVLERISFNSDSRRITRLYDAHNSKDFLPICFGYTKDQTSDPAVSDLVTTSRKVLVEMLTTGQRISENGLTSLLGLMLNEKSPELDDMLVHIVSRLVYIKNKKEITRARLKMFKSEHFEWLARIYPLQSDDSKKLILDKMCRFVDHCEDGELEGDLFGCVYGMIERELVERSSRCEEAIHILKISSKKSCMVVWNECGEGTFCTKLLQTLERIEEEKVAREIIEIFKNVLMGVGCRTEEEQIQQRDRLLFHSNLFEHFAAHFKNRYFEDITVARGKPGQKQVRKASLRDSRPSYWHHSEKCARELLQFLIDIFRELHKPTVWNKQDAQKILSNLQKHDHCKGEFHCICAVFASDDPNQKGNKSGYLDYDCKNSHRQLYTAVNDFWALHNILFPGKTCFMGFLQRHGRDTVAEDGLQPVKRRKKSIVGNY